jgi:hypothetical protein
VAVRLRLKISSASALKIIALLFLYLVGLSLLPSLAAATRAFADTQDRTAAATGPQRPAR